VFDQMRGDYLERWQTLFDADGGLRRLCERGAWYQNCHYPYAVTVTGPGHATLATGCVPAIHGIVSNDWAEAGAKVYCVGSERYALVFPPGGKEWLPGAKKPPAASPERLNAPTLADALKDRSGGKVVSLSFKDRAAVLPGGRKPDVCYWLDTDTGQFVTSTYYRTDAHRWVSEFNRGRPADQWVKVAWDRLRPELDYAPYSSIDDARGEGLGAGKIQGRTFPHPMTGRVREPGKEYYGALYNSPFGNDLLLQLASKAIVEENLGKGDQPDLLCLSFSCNDPIGHTWGPDSQEVLDVTLRSDRIMHDLLALLDERVGAGKYGLVLSADHGVCPLPEASRAVGRDAGRVSFTPLPARAEAHLTRLFGQAEGGWLVKMAEPVPPWLYLNQRALQQAAKDRGLDPVVLERSLTSWLEQQPGVLKAVSARELLGPNPPHDPLSERVRLSCYAGRSGDVAVVLKPYYQFSDPVGTGTGHGTPHPYDTHVPLLVYGPGVEPGPRAELVTPLAAAPILARMLGIPPPREAQAPVPTRLFAQER
jgi:hypothetical protein